MISYNTDLVQGVMKVLDDAGLFDLSVPEIIKLVEEKFTSTNNARDEIVALYGSWRVANPNVDASLVDSFVSWVQQHSPIAY